MKKTLLLCAVALTACATMGTDGVVTIGPNLYMIGRLGGGFDYSSSAIKAKLYSEATEFCAQKGLTMVPVSSTGRDAAVAVHASAEIQFRCDPSK